MDTPAASGRPSPLEAPWAATADAVADALGVDPRAGLDEAEAASRLRRHGPNELEVAPLRTSWQVLLGQFRGVLTWMLVAAAVLSAAFAQWSEALAVLVVLAINATAGFLTEVRAVRSVEALRRLGTAQATVRRGGGPAVVPAPSLVPGDVLVVEAGDVVPADARLVSAWRLAVDESALTGESVPVDKAPEPVAPAALLADRRPMLYRGTSVIRGRGEAVVVATGMRTELGRVAGLVRAAEPERTPLERRLDALGGRLLWVALGAAAAVAGYGLATGRGWFEMVQTAIALAVATVPEGLPVIATLTLARGAKRMADRNALVNRLSAVETLGATNVILTDKTGTLTHNRMAVAGWWLPDGRHEAGPGRRDPRRVAAGAEPIDRALRAAVLCGTASLSEGGADDVGDPMEVALLRAARDQGVERGALHELLPELSQLPFDADYRVMATFHQAEEGGLLLVKGAPGAVVPACVSVATPGGDAAPLDEAGREAWLERNRAMAAEGLRVLALADRRGAWRPGEPLEGLTLVGLVGLADPPREAAVAAVRECRRAGIRVVMVTGDQPVTARAIARSVGLAHPDAVVTGADLARSAADGEGPARAVATDVLARVSPEQKLRLVELHQAAGSVVAMIGDGVNDAPALRRADIGVAMGRRGTDVAREAAAMVLKDDDFATVVAAVEEGRAIFRNIRAAVAYLLSCNLSEILVIGLAAALGFPLPLLPLQILFLNLVTDVFPALALGTTPADPGVLDRPPRDPREPLVASRHWRLVAVYALLLTAPVLAAYALALGPLGLTTGQAVTVAFLGLALAQVFHVLNMRDVRRRRRTGAPAAPDPLTRNPWVWAAIAACCLMVASVTSLPPLRAALSVEALPAAGWALTLAVALLPTVAGQVGKSVGVGRVD
jgi:Ca2+-transporting ATPase